VIFKKTRHASATKSLFFQDAPFFPLIIVSINFDDLQWIVAAFPGVTVRSHSH
jgi:hypothetical protein